MKSKFPAATLKQLALAGTISRCEMCAFSAFHSATLDITNHVEYVEAFVLQLGVKEQHESILSILAGCMRGFAQGKIAYKPPNMTQLNSVLGVSRWVSSQLEGVVVCMVILKCTPRASTKI